MGLYEFEKLVYGLLVSEKTYNSIKDFICSRYKYTKFETSKQGTIYLFGFISEDSSGIFNPKILDSNKHLIDPNDFCDSQTVQMFTDILKHTEKKTTPKFYILNGWVCTLDYPPSTSYTFFSDYN